MLSARLIEIGALWALIFRVHFLWVEMDGIWLECYACRRIVRMQNMHKQDCNIRANACQHNDYCDVDQRYICNHCHFGLDCGCDCDCFYNWDMYHEEQMNQED